MLAQRAAQRADDPGHVLVGGVEHVLPHFGVDVDALHLDEARLAIAEHRAADGAFAGLGDHRQLDVSIEHAGLFLLRGRDLDAAFLGDHRGRDHVHRRVGGAHDAGNGSAVQRGQVHVGDMAVIEDVDRLDRLIRHLADEGAQMPGQLDPGAHDRGFFCGDRGHVERVLHGAGQKVVRHLLGHLQRHVLLRLGGGGTQMRGHHHVRQAEERAFCGGFDLEHVEGGAGDLAGFQGFGKGGLIHQTAAGAVDDPHAFLCLCKGFGVQDAAGLVGQRHMQGDEIGLCQQLIELHLGHAHRLGALFGQEGIVGQYLHVQAKGAVADDAADIAGADHAEGLVVKLDPHEARLFPLAGMGGDRGFGQLPRHGKHHRNRMFGGGDGVAEGRVHHDHAVARGGGNVNVINADPGAADDLEVRRECQQLVGHLGGRADGKAVILADDLGQFFLVLAEFGHVIHLDPAVAEDLHGGFGEFVGYENAGGHDGLL